MKQSVLGRTNRVFPKVWLRLEVPDQRTANESLADFVNSAAALAVPIDISVAPALFGGLLPNIAETVLIQVSSTDFETAADAKQAADLVQAHLIETLCCIGRPYIDFYFLRLRRTLEESQLAGIMEALESARQEDHVRFLGLYAESFGATLGNWQFHDAFDVISVPETLRSADRDTLKRMAHQRRTGFLVRVEKIDSRPGQDGTDQDETLILSVNQSIDFLQLGEVA